MRKVIAAINMTLDAFCDHTAGLPDDEILQHYTSLLNHSDTILYGRITYQLMEYWRPFVKNAKGEKATDDFAKAIDKIPKIVFSNTLEKLEWASSQLANDTLEEEILKLKQQMGKDILVGSRSIIIQLMKLNMIDEYQFCIYPVVEGGGLSLFENIGERIVLKLIKTRILKGGSIILYYERK